MAKAARATISDVAKAAKTGKTSISRYLNGEKHLLSDDLLGRIEKAIAAAAGVGPMATCDILIIGSGGAGLRAAVAALKKNPKLNVVVVSKCMPSRSATCMAEGGINGRKIKYISVDDGYNPAKTVEQARKLATLSAPLLMATASPSTWWPPATVRRWPTAPPSGAPTATVSPAWW